MDTVDYIVVGAGAAGCVLANRLSADASVRVAVIEPGPDRNSRRMLVKMPLGMVTFMMPQHDLWDSQRYMQWYASEPEPRLGGRRIALPRGQGTGGCTSINGMIYVRGQREDFDHWRDLGNPGWGYDDLLPWFRRIESYELLRNADATPGLSLGGKPVADQTDPRFHGVDGPLNLAPVRSVNPIGRVFLDAVSQAGYPLNADFNGARQEGFGYYSFTQKDGCRVSAEGAYLDPVRASRPNLSVLSGRRVERVLIEGKRAVGVAWAGTGNDAAKKGELRATREVIVCAGAFASPQILMLSGIGAPEQLQPLGIEVRHALPGVGANLQDHLDVTLEYRSKTTLPYGISWRALPRNVGHVADWLLRRRGLFASTTGEAGGFVRTRADVPRPDVQVFFCTSVGNAQNAGSLFGHGFLIHVCELRPGSLGSVTLQSAAPEAAPRIRYNFFQGHSTPESLIAGVKLVRGIVGQKAFEPHVECEVTPGAERVDDRALDAWVRERVGTLYHPVGTCKMGRDAQAVVDPETLAVHGVQGLRVIDASVMPTIVSGNTMAATYCIAEKGAEMVLQGSSR